MANNRWSERERAKSNRALLINIWEWATDMGEGELITFERWMSRYYPNDKPRARDSSNRHSGAAGKAWERFKRRVRRSPWPVEFRPTVTQTASGVMTRAVAVVFPLGTARTVAKVLDAIEVEFELAYLRKADRAKFQKRSPGRTDDVVYSVVASGGHRSIKCPVCQEPEGLSCQGAKGATVVHMDRVRKALSQSVNSPS